MAGTFVSVVFLYPIKLTNGMRHLFRLYTELNARPEKSLKGDAGNAVKQ